MTNPDNKNNGVVDKKPISVDKPCRFTRVTVTYSDICVDASYLANFLWKHNLTYTVLAKLLDVKQRVVGKWLVGKKKIPYPYQVAIFCIEEGDCLKKLYKVERESL